MALMTTNCPWQELTNQAYDRWQDHDREVRKQLDNGQLTLAEARKQMWGFREMLASCTYAEAVACVLGKLNQQIENGGVAQWVENGYAAASVNLLAQVMPQMGKASAQVWKILSEFLQDWSDEDGEFYEDDECSGYHDDSDRVSDKFYALQDDWHPEVYAYIASISHGHPPQLGRTRTICDIGQS